MDHILIAQRIRRILQEIEARRAAGEPWPPSSARIGEIIAEVDAESAQRNRQLGIH